MLGLKLVKSLAAAAFAQLPFIHGSPHGTVTGGTNQVSPPRASVREVALNQDFFGHLVP